MQGWGPGWGSRASGAAGTARSRRIWPHPLLPSVRGCPGSSAAPKSRSLPPTRMTSSSNLRGALPALPHAPRTRTLPAALALRGPRGAEDAPAWGKGLRGERGDRDSHHHPPTPRSPQPKPSAREASPPTGRGGPHLAAARPPTLLLQTGDELQLLLLVRAVHFGRWGRE